jgi:hypothetical protein
MSITPVANSTFNGAQTNPIHLTSPKEPTQSFETFVSGQVLQNQENCQTDSLALPFITTVSLPVVPAYKLNKLSFLKGMEDGKLSMADLKADFEALFDKFDNLLRRNKINASNLELMTDDNGELGVLNNLPGGEKERILDILKDNPEFKKLFGQMQFIAELQQHPELLDDFSKAYQENPAKSLADYNKLLGQKYEDGIFVLGIKNHEYQITFKKVTIEDFQAELEEALSKFENNLRTIAANHQLDFSGKIKLQDDGKITLETNSPDKAKIEQLLREDESLLNQQKRIGFLKGIIENPGMLQKYARTFLLKQY